MKITKILLFFILLFVSTFTFAQGQPVHFSVQQKKVSPTELHIMFKGIINDGWHVYSTDLPAGGPISTSLTIEKAIGVKPIGKLIAKGREINLNDPVFSMKLRYFEKQVTFIQKYKITGKVYNIKGRWPNIYQLNYREGYRCKAYRQTYSKGKRNKFK